MRLGLISCQFVCLARMACASDLAPTPPQPRRRAVATRTALRRSRSACAFVSHDPTRRLTSIHTLSVRHNQATTAAERTVTAPVRPGGARCRCRRRTLSLSPLATTLARSQNQPHSGSCSFGNPHHRRHRSKPADEHGSSTGSSTRLPESFHYRITSPPPTRLLRRRPRADRNKKPGVPGPGVDDEPRPRDSSRLLHRTRAGAATPHRPARLASFPHDQVQRHPRRRARAATVLAQFQGRTV